MVKLPGVIAKDTMSAMVKFAEIFQESSLDLISYSMVSQSVTISREKMIVHSNALFFFVQLNARCSSMGVLRGKLQYPRSKQHFVRSLLRRISRKWQTRLWSTKLRIEADTRVKEVKSQIETVFNKDEMIDETSCTKGHSYKGSYPLDLHQVAEEDTSQSQEERVYWNVASSSSVASSLCRSIRFPSPRRSI